LQDTLLHHSQPTRASRVGSVRIGQLGEAIRTSIDFGLRNAEHSHGRHPNAGGFKRPVAPYNRSGVRSFGAETVGQARRRSTLNARHFGPIHQPVAIASHGVVAHAFGTEFGGSVVRASSIVDAVFCTYALDTIRPYF
jgi:hypothetical protein